MMKKIVTFLLLISTFTCPASQNSDSKLSSSDLTESITKEKEKESQANNLATTIKNINNPKEDNTEKEKDTYNGINNPIQTGKITTIKSPIIIDYNNSDFDDVSTLLFSENIILNRSNNYNYPKEYTDHKAAIIVAKDNITIDFSGFNLSLDTSEKKTDIIHGISILPGVKNTKIISSDSCQQKGSITDFSYGYGIYIQGTKETDLFHTQDGIIGHTTISNMLINKNKSGIYVENALCPQIINTHIINNGSLTDDVYGICMINVINGNIENCRINVNYSNSNITGIYLENTIDVIVKKCELYYNISLLCGSVTGIEITATSMHKSHCNEIYDTIINCNQCSYASNQQSVGFFINNLTNHNLISNCEAKRNIARYNSEQHKTLDNPPKSIGFKITNSYGNYITNNKSLYHNDFGFEESDIVSTSLYVSNKSIYNGVKNFNIKVQNPLQPDYFLYLPVVTLYQGDLSFLQSSTPPYSNVEIKNPS